MFSPLGTKSPWKSSKAGVAVLCFVVSHSKTFIKTESPIDVSSPSLVLVRIPITRSLTCDVDSVDEGLWDSVPNVHQAGHVDNNIGPAGGLQHAVIICDVPLNGHHLCPLWGRDRKTQSKPRGTMWPWIRAVFLSFWIYLTGSLLQAYNTFCELCTISEKIHTLKNRF